MHPAKCHTSDSAVCWNWRGRIPAAGTLCVMGGEGAGQKTHIQLVVNIGSILQQGVHHLGVSILRRDSECCAAVLPRKHVKTDTEEKLNEVSTVDCSLSKQTLCIIFVFVSSSPAMHIMVSCTAAYLCLQFSWGTEFKEELHHIMVSLLGGEEQGSRTSLEGKLKKDPADVISPEQRWKHNDLERMKALFRPLWSHLTCDVKSKSSDFQYKGVFYSPTTSLIKGIVWYFLFSLSIYKLVIDATIHMLLLPEQYTSDAILPMWGAIIDFAPGKLPNICLNFPLLTAPSWMPL